MKKIHFYISNSNHHWQMMKPVMKELLKRGNVEVKLVSLCEFRRMKTPEDELKKIGIPFEKLTSLKFRGASTSTGKRSIGGNKAFLRNSLRALIWYLKLKANVVEANRYKPDLVIVPNDIAFPFNMICKWFIRKHIQFILFQEGIRFPLPNEDGWTNYGNNGAKEILAWGEDSARYFNSLELTNTKVIASGNPRFDEVLKIDYSNEINLIRSQLRLRKYNILYVSNPVDDQGFCSHAEKIDLFRQFLARIKNLMDEKDIVVLVRLHPREDIEAFKAVVAGTSFEDKVFFVQQYALFACLRIVDLSVILASTVGLESMMCNTPVAVVKLPRYGYVFNYVSSGCAVGIDPGVDFSEVIWAAMTTQKEELKAKCKVYVSGQLSNTDGSVEFISNHLEKLLNVG